MDKLAQEVMLKGTDPFPTDDIFACISDQRTI